MPFEDIPSTPDAQELLDAAYSRAARAGRAKSGIDGQRSMLDTAANILSDNLEHVSTTWPDLDGLHPFFATLVDALVGRDELRQHLASVSWASRQIDTIAAEHRSRMRGDTDRARAQRRQAFARMADVLDEVADDLAAIEDARRRFARIPGIDPELPTIVIAGYPNVGKSSFLNAVTRASAETASYPFTTTEIEIGHFEYRHVSHQIIDTPGLLDRPPADRNRIERQAIAALEYLADTILVFVDPSETCGYPLGDQLALRDAVEARFESADIPVLTIRTKADLDGHVEADAAMSVTEDDGVDDVLELALQAVDYSPVLPYERD